MKECGECDKSPTPDAAIGPSYEVVFRSERPQWDRWRGDRLQTVWNAEVFRTTPGERVGLWHRDENGEWTDRLPGGSETGTLEAVQKSLRLLNERRSRIGRWVFGDW